VRYDAERLGRDLEAHERQLTPIGGRLIPEDIAPMAVYLASDAARMITGQAYNIDGGICMA
jgi:NAD(P)-dependent dehydrogenase (short-subunit alcohol dehydrogenase family)